MLYTGVRTWLVRAYTVHPDSKIINYGDVYMLRLYYF